jgi:hypothetical protein
MAGSKTDIGSVSFGLFFSVFSYGGWLVLNIFNFYTVTKSYIVMCINAPFFSNLFFRNLHCR